MIQPGVGVSIGVQTEGIPGVQGSYHAQVRLGGDPRLPHAPVTVLREGHLVIVLDLVDDSNCGVANLKVDSRGRVVPLPHGNRDVLPGAGAHRRVDGRVLGGGSSRP